MADPMLVSIKDAPMHIGVSEREVYRLIQRGELETVQYGRRRLIRWASLQAWVRRLEDEQPEPPHRLPLAGTALRSLAR